MTHVLVQRHWCGTCRSNPAKKSFIFYGTKLQNQELNASTTTTPSDMIPTSNQKNLLVTDSTTFLIVPSTLINVKATIDQNDLSNGYVKMSDVRTVCGISKDKFSPNAEDLTIFSSLIAQFIHEDKKSFAMENCNYYFLETVSEDSKSYFVNGLTTNLKLFNILPIDMDK
jgi:hypothetical protein